MNAVVMKVWRSMCGCALVTWMPAVSARCRRRLGGRVPVHSGAVAVKQDRPPGSGAYCPVDGPADRWRQRYQGDLGTFAAHAQDPVAVFFAEIGYVRGGGLEDPQAQQPEHGYRREIARVRRFPGGGEQGLELQVGEPQGG